MNCDQCDNPADFYRTDEFGLVWWHCPRCYRLMCEDDFQDPHLSFLEVAAVVGVLVLLFILLTYL